MGSELLIYYTLYFWGIYDFKKFKMPFPQESNSKKSVLPLSIFEILIVKK